MLPPSPAPAGAPSGSTTPRADMNIKLCGINLQGEFFSVPAADLAAARSFGADQMQQGLWRAWDAFDITPNCPKGRRLIESSTSVVRKTITGNSTVRLAP